MILMQISVWRKEYRVCVLPVEISKWHKFWIEVDLKKQLFSERYMSDPTNTDDDDNQPTYSFEKLKRRSSIDNLKKNEILIQKMVSHSFEGRDWQ